VPSPRLSNGCPRRSPLSSHPCRLFPRRPPHRPRPARGRAPCRGQVPRHCQVPRSRQSPPERWVSSPLRLENKIHEIAPHPGKLPYAHVVQIQGGMQIQCPVSVHSQTLTPSSFPSLNSLLRPLSCSVPCSAPSVPRPGRVHHQSPEPPYKIVDCNVVNPFNTTVCLHLACSPIVPGGCPTGPGAAGSSNEACAWNVKPPGTTMYPVQAGMTWNFGWSTTDPNRVTCRPIGPGFALLAPGERHQLCSQN